MEMETPGPEPVPATTCWVAFGKSPLASVKRKADAVFPALLFSASQMLTTAPPCPAPPTDKSRSFAHWPGRHSREL